MTEIEFLEKSFLEIDDPFDYWSMIEYDVIEEMKEVA
jgi:hypothetical protein